MTKVKIEPGVCGFVTEVTAEKKKRYDCIVTVDSPCPTIQAMMAELGNEFNGMDVCLKKPGQNLFYTYAAEKYPAHAGCPMINGIIKCIEAECGLALKRDASISFIE